MKRIFLFIGLLLCVASTVFSQSKTIPFNRLILEDEDGTQNTSVLKNSFITVNKDFSSMKVRLINAKTNGFFSFNLTLMKVNQDEKSKKTYFIYKEDAGDKYLVSFEIEDKQHGFVIIYQAITKTKFALYNE